MRSIRFIALALVAMAAPVAAIAAPPAPPAPAQAPAPAADASPLLGGPVIPGVCYLARDEILTRSKVALYAGERIKAIKAEAQAEIDADGKPLNAQIAAIQAQEKAGKLGHEAAVAAARAALEKGQPALAAKAELRNREIEKTRAKVIEDIMAQAQPLIAQAYQQKACGALLDRALLLAGNRTNDLTPLVIAALDAKVTTLNVVKETIAPATR